MVSLSHNASEQKASQVERVLLHSCQPGNLHILFGVMFGVFVVRQRECAGYLIKVFIALALLSAQSSFSMWLRKFIASSYLLIKLIVAFGNFEF